MIVSSLFATIIAFSAINQPAQVLVGKVDHVPKKYLVVGEPNTKNYKIRVRAGKIRFLGMKHISGFRAGLLRFAEKEVKTELPNGIYPVAVEFNPLAVPNLSIFKADE